MITPKLGSKPQSWNPRRANSSFYITLNTKTFRAKTWIWFPKSNKIKSFEFLLNSQVLHHSDLKLKQLKPKLWTRCNCGLDTRNIVSAVCCSSGKSLMIFTPQKCRRNMSTHYMTSSPQKHRHKISTHCNTLQHTATHCNTWLLRRHFWEEDVVRKFLGYPLMAHRNTLQ